MNDSEPPLKVELTSLDYRPPVGIIPLETSPPPLETSPPPLETSPPPLETSPPPLETSPPPLETSPLSDDLAYPDGIYQYILKMCFFHPINIIAGFYYGNPIGGTMGLVLCMTSINYWRNPLMNSARRYIDMAIAFIAVPYHIYLSLFTTDKLLCAGTIILGALAYPFSIWLEQKKYIKTAAFFHCVLHGLVIAGATLTYRDYYIYSQ